MIDSITDWIDNLSSPFQEILLIAWIIAAAWIYFGLMGEERAEDSVEGLFNFIIFLFIFVLTPIILPVIILFNVLMWIEENHFS